MMMQYFNLCMRLREASYVRTKVTHHAYKYLMLGNKTASFLRLVVLLELKTLPQMDHRDG